MIKQSFTIVFAFLSGIGAAAAEPCVSATFDKPLEGAIDVVTRHVDVPSPQFPGLWQEGTLRGFSYAIYANGEGIVAADKAVLAWKIKISCPAKEADCTLVLEGAPPEGANSVATEIALCLRGETLPKEEPPQAEPLAPCGLATLEDGTDGRLLQQLLVIAGADPGPVDGFVGNDTRKALAEVLGAPSASLDTAKAVAALNQFICK